jgi:nitrite reductase (NADH) small subunit
MTSNPSADWTKLCDKDDLIAHSGIAAVYQGQQIALFYMPNYENEIFAIGNNDPFSGANILARGLIGDLKGEPMVASPLYKQHFSLNSGTCFEDEEVRVPVWPVRIQGENVEIMST